MKPFNFSIPFCLINRLNLVQITTDLEKKVADAFLIFDHHGNKSVDVREVGTILRYLGKDRFSVALKQISVLFF